MRNRLDTQIQALNAALIEMGMMVEHAISQAARALVEKDAALARDVIRLDRRCDEKEREIEALCLKLLLRQQPVARDLRLISAAMKMITDMERIADQAADIAEITTLLADVPYARPLVLTQEMARETIWMVKTAVDAFVGGDLSLAGSVVAHDDVVDGLFDQIKQELIGLINQDVQQGGPALDLLMIAKYLERIGDHATNIAQWVEFSITGAHRSEEV